MLIAWALSLIIYPVLVVAVGRALGSADSGDLEAILGLGVLIAIPSLAFAGAVAAPAMWWLAGLRPGWLVPLVAGAVFALLFWALAAALLPEGWRGAGAALAGYGAVLGLVWGSLNLLRMSTA